MEAVAEGQAKNKNRLLKNSFYSSLSWGGSVVVNIVMVPLMVSFLGIEGYGIFALLTSLFGYFSLLDFGLAQGVVRYVAHYTGLNDQRSTMLAINSALVMQTIVGGSGLAGLWIFNGDLIRLLHISASYQEPASSALYASAIGFLVTMLVGTFSSALIGVQRYDIVGKTTLILSIASSLISAGVLVFGGGLLGVVLVNVASSFAALIVFAYLTFRIIPGLSLHLNIDLHFIQRMFGFTKYTFLSQISGFFYTAMVRFIIGVLKGPEAVSYFVVPLKLVAALQGAFGSLVGVLFPYASDLSAQGKHGELGEVYHKASRYFLALSVPLYLFVAVFAREILSLWVGKEFANSSWVVLSILTSAYWLSAWTMIPSNIVTGMGDARTTGFFSAGVASLSLLLVVFLVPVFGNIGAAAGLLFVPLVGAPLFIWYVNSRILKVAMREYVSRVFVPCVTPLGVFAIAIIAGGLAVRFIVPLPDVVCLGAGCILLLSYLVVAERMHLVSRSDLFVALRTR